jgi:predicted acetyltransferase
MMVSAENDPRRAGTIWMINLDEPTPVITPLVPTTFCRVGAESVSVLASVMGAGSSAEILKRFETRRRCYAAWVEGKLAAYGWVSPEEEFIGELNLRIKLIPGEVYVWDCFTVPTFRQYHLYSALLTYIIAELRAEQLCRVWIGADLNNIASQRGIARAGFHYIADLVIERVLALRFAWAQGRPDVPNHLVTEARRAFLDNREKVWLKALSSVIQN